MAFSIYQASIPVFIRQLGHLAAILNKADIYAASKKIDPSVFLNDRLAPDMFPLTRQVQIASDAAKGAGARLAGLEVPNFSDTETTFADLQARITKTIDFLKSIDPTKLEGSEDRIVNVKLRGNELALTGQAYLLHISIPNFYFHITTTYDILRHNGVDLGKADYLGNP